MGNAPQKSAIRRLMKDQEELIKCPVQNISAAPLDSNMFEWHCNIKQDENTMYHLILFFPDDYPYSSPRAEFVPAGLQYGVATKRGKKGDQICLNIFSVFGDAWSGWDGEKGTGWSPGYTAQTILLNVVSFLAEFADGNDLNYQREFQRFKCYDCGHTFSKPYPSLEIVDAKSTKKVTRDEIQKQDAISVISSQIVDYISKEKLDPNATPSEKGVFGYGLVITQRGRRSTLTTPCEFLTADTFYNMKRSKGVIYSIMKERLSYFLPLYINQLHGSKIRNEFQKMLKDIKQVLPEEPVPEESKRTPNYSDIVLELIPNLMCSTVVEFSKGCTHTSDNNLQGYFALHRLFIWAISTYPELQENVEKRLHSFVETPEYRTKDICPDIGQWLMLLSVSKRFTWQSVSDAYLSESFKRNVMWYLKSNKRLGSLDMSQNERLEHTFKLTAVSRNLLAFQVAFLKIAKPDTMTMEQILDRYEANLGFPSADMVDEMKEVCQTINSKINNYEDWYGALGLRYPSNSSMFETLKESLVYARSTKGYFSTPNRPRR